MDLEERLENLEEEVASLREEVLVFARAYLHETGESQAYRHAVLALMSNPSIGNQEILDSVLREDFSRSEAILNGECTAEEQVTGLQYGQKLILMARDESKRLRFKLGPVNHKNEVQLATK